jgi:hypothetical protein
MSFGLCKTKEFIELQRNYRPSDKARQYGVFAGTAMLSASTINLSFSLSEVTVVLYFRSKCSGRYLNVR